MSEMVDAFSNEPPLVRIGHYIIGLLVAAHEIGDPALIALVEEAALRAGVLIAGSLDSPEDVTHEVGWL